MYLMDLFRRKALPSPTWETTGRDPVPVPPGYEQEKPPAIPLQVAQEGRLTAKPHGDFTVSPPRKSALPPPTYARNVAQPSRIKRTDADTDEIKRKLLAWVIWAAPHEGSETFDLSLEQMAAFTGMHKSTMSRWRDDFELRGWVSIQKKGRLKAMKATAVARDYL